MSNRGPSLTTGGLLATNDYLCSADGSYFAIMQSDGNFVIKHGEGLTNQGTVVWNSGVAPGGDPHFFVILQKEGNLVAYRGDPMNQGAPIWNSGSAPGAGANQYVATLQNDGNLVITMGATEPPTVVWSTRPVIPAKKISSLTTGGFLTTNDYLCSADGSHVAILQSDGNFVIHQGNSPANAGAVVWSSGVAPGGDPHFFAILQKEGNLVIYRGSDPTHQGTFVWNSGPAPAVGQYVATLQNDGNLAITTATVPSTLVWSTQPQPLAKKSPTLAMGGYLATNDYLSSADGSYFAIMQAAGNLVIYHGGAPVNQGAYVWDSKVVPGGDPHFFAIMQTDGNLVIYRGSDPIHQGAFVWNSGIAPGTENQYVATLQNDGNLVITAGSQPPVVVWSAQPIPSITLTVTNNMAFPIGVSTDAFLPSLPQNVLNLSPGKSGSLLLPLNRTTNVGYTYTFAWCDERLGIVADENLMNRSYTVATSDTTLTVSVTFAGGPAGLGLTDSGIGTYPTVSETLPTGVTVQG